MSRVSPIKVDIQKHFENILKYLQLALIMIFNQIQGPMKLHNRILLALHKSIYLLLIHVVQKLLLQQKSLL